MTRKGEEEDGLTPRKIRRVAQTREPRKLFSDDLFGTVLFGLVIGLSSGFISAIGSKLGEAFIKSTGRTIEENTGPDFHVPDELK